MVAEPDRGRAAGADEDASTGGRADAQRLVQGGLQDRPLRWSKATKAHLLSLCKCDECPLQPVRAPVLGDGPVGSDLALVGEAPGRKESFMGRCFMGPAGEALDQMLREAGTERSRVYVTNAALCRPPLGPSGENTPPPAQAVRACGGRLREELRLADPKVLMPLGNTAVSAITSATESIGKLAGATLWSDEYDLPVVPTIHPAAVLHKESARYTEDILSAMRRALSYARGELPPVRKEDPIAFEDCRTELDGLRALRAMSARPVLALDTETTGLRYLDDALIMLQISDGERTWVLTEDALHSGSCRRATAALLSDLDRVWIMHNMSFDLQVLRHAYGVEPARVEDTMIYSMGVSEQSHRNGLKYLTTAVLGQPYYAGDVDEFKKRKESFAKIPHEVLAEYGARDALNTYRLRPILRDMAAKEGTLDLCTGFLNRTARTFTDMEYRGVRVDREWIAHLSDVWLPQIERAKEDLQAYAESVGFKGKVVETGRKGCKVSHVEPFNPNSNPQLQTVAYDILGLAPPPDKHGKYTGKRTTDKSFLALYAAHPFVKLIENYRQRAHLYSSYVKGIDKHIWSDGRVHPDLRLGGAVTGRISIQNPALQTVPHYKVDPQLAYEVRRIFVPDDGHLIFDCDFAQLEVHVLHHYSRDAALGEALAEDFHTLTASALHKLPKERITKVLRATSKTLVFGIIYGMDAVSLASSLGVPVPQAQGYIDAFWALYADARRWLDETRDEAERTGRLVTPFGRVRRWDLWTPGNRAGNRREAGNFPIQSFASDLNLAACNELTISLTQRGLGFPMFPVHDSIVGQVREDRAEEGLRLVVETMGQCPVPTCATFPAEASAGPTWADVKDIKL